MDPVTLWHGTTETAATSITANGFVVVDTRAVVERVALEHGVAADSLVGVLADLGRWVVTQDERDNAAWFASSPEAAARWAQRAPEARWEALWGVWCLRNGWSRGDTMPWALPEASAWHAAQFLAERPAVVEVRIPPERMLNAHRRPYPPEKLGAVLSLLPRGRVAQIAVLAPVPADWVVRCRIVERRVGVLAAAGMLAVTPEQVVARSRAGQLPKVVFSRLGDEPYFYLDELASHVPSLQ